MPASASALHIEPYTNLVDLYVLSPNLNELVDGEIGAGAEVETQRLVGQPWNWTKYNWKHIRGTCIILYVKTIIILFIINIIFHYFTFTINIACKYGGRHEICIK